MSLIFYLITGVILFGLLRISEKALNAELISEKIHPVFLRLFPTIEFILWFIYLLWALNGIFGHWDYYNIIISSIIISIVIGLGWFIAKDFIAGIVLKSEISLKTNQYINIPQTKGILRKLGFRSLEIEAEDGQIIKVPYSSVIGDIITYQSKGESLKGYETALLIRSNIREDDACELITKELMLLPWTVSTRLPSVKFIDQNESIKKYQVKFFAINQQHAEKISQHLNEIFTTEEKKDKL